MKKLLFILTGFILLGISNNGKAQTINAIENQLYAASNECLQPWRNGNAGNVDFVIENASTNICFVSGIVHTIEIWAYFSCPNRIEEFCRPRGPVHVATATYNCDGSNTVVCVTQPE